MTIYSLDVLLFQFGTSLLFHVQFFLTCRQISQEAGQVVWYSHFLKNFSLFVMIHMVKVFGLVNKADVFQEISCFFDDPADIGNLISCASAFSKSSLSIWKLTVPILLKPGVENFEHYFVSMWNECNCVVAWTFYGIAFLWERNGVAIIFNKRVQNAVLGCNLKNDRMISICFQGKLFNSTVTKSLPQPLMLKNLR